MEEKLNRFREDVQRWRSPGDEKVVIDKNTLEDEIHRVLAVFPDEVNLMKLASVIAANLVELQKSGKVTTCNMWETIMFPNN